MSLIHKFKNLVYLLLSSPIFFKPLTKIFRNTAVTGRGSNLCLKHGFLPVPVNFHSPIPDIGDLEERNIWNVRNALVGVDFREDEQIALLHELGANYSEECKWPLLPTDNPFDFYVQNQSFSYGCAASTHCMIRNSKPNLVVEIGSGMSSRVITNALLVNQTEDNYSGKHVIVDPYPDDVIKNRSSRSLELIESRVELLDPTWFDQLKAEDILFIDSGHCVRIGGDVNYLFLDVLPRLNPGVIVHIHDIGLPYEYPRTYAINESFRQFWTEQYLLQSFLCFNSEFEILLALNYLMTDHAVLFRELFPAYDPENHSFVSGSFWIRRKKK
jgi:hypothetical protein